MQIYFAYVVPSSLLKRRCPFLLMGVYFFQVKFDVQGEEVIIFPENESDIEESNESANSNQLETKIERVLVAKDIGLIPDESYHELRMSLPGEERSVLPPITVLKDERNKQDKNIASYPIPEIW